MYVLQNLHWFVLLLGALIFVHEFGHFVVAKLVGIKVLKFSLGFGPRVVGITRGETEYVISLLPLGGYVKMLGELPGVDIPPADLPRSLGGRPLWQRTLVVFAGPAFNILLAGLVYWGMFIGTQTYGAPKLGIVSYGEAAWAAGLRPGDVIVSIDAQPIDDWDELRDIVGSRPDASLRVVYARDGVEHATLVQPKAHEVENIFQEAERRGRIGVVNVYVRPVIAVVDGESPAAKAGLHSGDLVLSVNGKAVAAWHELRAALAAVPASEPVQLVVRRSRQESMPLDPPATQRDAAAPRDATVQRESAALSEPETLSITLRVGERPAGLPSDAWSSADTGFGYTGLVSHEVVVDKVEPGTPAATAGVLPGDRLLRLRTERPDGTVVARAIDVWSIDSADFSGTDARSRFVLTIQRGREVSERPLTLASREEKDELKNVRTQYVFGATTPTRDLDTYVGQRHVGVVSAFGGAVKQVGRDMTLIGMALGKLIGGKLPFNTMGGPIMLFVIAEKSAKLGLEAYLRTLAVISVNLGMLNLLPVPVLDGGHLFFFAFEALRRRPASLRVRELANIVGFVLLMLLMLLVFKNDIWRYVLG